MVFFRLACVILHEHCNGKAPLERIDTSIGRGLVFLVRGADWLFDHKFARVRVWEELFVGGVEV